MIFHGLTEKRVLRFGDGSEATQDRFYCHIHGWFDLFVFPGAKTQHNKCNQIEQPAAVEDRASSLYDALTKWAQENLTDFPPNLRGSLYQTRETDFPEIIGEER